jgi:hypothetical protein
MPDEPEVHKPPRPDVPRYYRVACHFWSDENVVRWSDPMKLLALYILTTKHRNLEGFYVLPPEYVAADMRWSLRRVKDTLAKLEEAQFLRIDRHTNLLLIRNALRYQQPESKNVQKAILSRVRNLPDNSDMLRDFCKQVRIHCMRSGLSPYAQGLAALLEKEFSLAASDGNRGDVGTGIVSAFGGALKLLDP